MRIFYEGTPKDNETEAKVKEIVASFEYGDYDYVIGIDYAAKDSKDFTVVAKYRMNEYGAVTCEKVEYF